MLPELSTIDPEKAAVIEKHFPETAMNLLRLVGFHATLAVVREFGGIDVRLPAEKNKLQNKVYSQLVALIGEKKAEAIRFEYQNENYWYVPMCARAMYELQKIEITREFDDLLRNESSRKAVIILARKYWKSNRAIENIVNGKSSPIKRPTHDE